jgi:hypothetical protein
MRVTKDSAIKAYKVFLENWTCREFRYEVGKTYHCRGSIVPCKNGFHCCKNLIDCFNYYSFAPCNKVAEVRIWGTVVQKGDKLAASNIEIVREMSWHDVLNMVNDGTRNTGMNNTGSCNSGDNNYGNWNTGQYNDGEHNTGDTNKGSFNTGSCNFGAFNTGDHNHGSCNTGSNNEGFRNSGYYNVGKLNTGSWNKGDNHHGCFNTVEQKPMYFNKESDVEYHAFPSFLYFNLTKWIPAENMTEDEKKKHGDCRETGGYLKKMSYKEAFRESFLKAKERKDWQYELNLLKSIPNFDAEIFYEISGIKPEELV